MIKMQNVRKTYPGFDFELSLESRREESPDLSEKTEQERARRSA